MFVVFVSFAGRLGLAWFTARLAQQRGDRSGESVLPSVMPFSSGAIALDLGTRPESVIGTALARSFGAKATEA